MVAWSGDVLTNGQRHEAEEQALYPLQGRNQARATQEFNSASPAPSLLGHSGPANFSSSWRAKHKQPSVQRAHRDSERQETQEGATSLKPGRRR